MDWEKTKPIHAVNNTYQRSGYKGLFLLSHLEQHPPTMSGRSDPQLKYKSHYQLVKPQLKIDILLKHVRYCISQTNYLHV